MKMYQTFILGLLLIIGSASAADIKALTKLYHENFDNYYQPRFCGRNTERLANEALKRNIDLSNSYVLKIVGGGFLETSAFYTREKTNERAMLGYFHMVLVADGYVFDFDLDEPLVLKIKDYFRLQFTPPYEPYRIYGVDYTGNSNPSGWTVTAFDTYDYAKSDETKLWVKKVNQYINMKELYDTKRIR